MRPSDRTPAPGHLALVQAFINTRDLSAASDELASPADARRWLVRNRLIDPLANIRPSDHARVLAVREALRGLAAANARERPDRRAVIAVNEAVGRVRLGVALHPDEGYRLMAEGAGVDRPIGGILVRVLGAMTDGTWERLKICTNAACGWAFYDESRNRSGVWCSMALCGNRIKGRAYRRRRAAATVAGGAVDARPDAPPEGNPDSPGTI
jgi:predicted RNA-binding Zn ribbon-like protein